MTLGANAPIFHRTLLSAKFVNISGTAVQPGIPWRGTSTSSEVTGRPWTDLYSDSYEAKSREARETRRQVRKKARSKRSFKVETNPLKIEGARIGFERARSRAALIDMRWRFGFQWGGGFVGGNPRYRRGPLCYKGLVSSEHAVLKLFVSKLPRARTLQTGYNKRLLDGTDSKLLACDCDYVEANKAMRGVLRVELDGVLDSWNTIQEMCRVAGIPLPNIAVGYADQAGKVWNPHLVWLLADSVTFCGRGRRAPRRLYQGVLRGLTAALMPWGADPGGISNALRLKNPLCPTWNRQVFAEEPYSLEQLRAHVDIGGQVADLERRADGSRHADHPDPRHRGRKQSHVPVCRSLRLRIDCRSPCSRRNSR